jgi:hypothetical protein
MNDTHNAAAIVERPNEEEEVNRAHRDIFEKIKTNDLDFLRYACYRSAEVGNVDNLKTLHEMGCYWDENVCLIASKMGNIDCLMYAVENGCPWKIEECLNATLIKKQGKIPGPGEYPSSTMYEIKHMRCYRYITSKK